MMNTINFSDKTLIEILLRKVPEFEKEIIPQFKFSAYIVYGNFGSFIQSILLDNVLNIDLITRSFNLINELVENGDENVLIMLKVTVFEILSDYDIIIEKAKFYLNEKALLLFSEVIKFFKE